MSNWTGCFQVIFSADQTHELMFCLEELTSSLSTAAPGADKLMQVWLAFKGFSLWLIVRIFDQLID